MRALSLLCLLVAWSPLLAQSSTPPSGSNALGAPAGDNKVAASGSDSLYGLAIKPSDHRVTDLITWLRQIGKDDAKFIVLEKTSE
jgi:hypothetical protein